MALLLLVNRLDTPLLQAFAELCKDLFGGRTLPAR